MKGEGISPSYAVESTVGCILWHHQKHQQYRRYVRALTDRRDVGVVVALVTVPMDDARLADVRVAQHKHLVRGREIQCHGRRSGVVAFAFARWCALEGCSSFLRLPSTS